MRTAPRYYLVGDDGEIHRLAQRTFFRILEQKTATPFPQLKGRRVRLATLHVQLEGTEASSMSGFASAAIARQPVASSSRRPATWLVAAAATVLASLAIAVLMTVSILLAAPLPSSAGDLAPQPMPGPMAPANVDR